MTTDQAKVLNVMRNHGAADGLFSWRVAMLCNKPTYYANPKLKALEKLGLVRRHESNREYWFLAE